MSLYPLKHAVWEGIWYNTVIREREDVSSYSVSRKRLKPTNDFVAKKLFGAEDGKAALLSFLNAILGLDGEEKLVDVKILNNKELTKEWIELKTGRLDIWAETKDGRQINLEVQLVDKHNMGPRTVFYNSKLLLGTVKSGNDYQSMKQTITINIVDFRLPFPVAGFHSVYHLREDQEQNVMLTDLIEIHFIELPKFREIEPDLENPLHRWLLFMDEHMPEQLLKELMAMDPVIKDAEERLERLGSDWEARLIYDYRESAMLEKNSLIRAGYDQGMEEGKKEGMEKGEKEGMEKGMEKGMAAVIRKMLASGMDVERVAEIVGKPVEEVQRLNIVER